MVIINVLFSYVFLGDNMLFLKGFIIGLAKIIPGVSGAMIAMYLNLYEKLLDAITNFFSNWKDNLKFIIIFGLGLFLAIILGSKIILSLLLNYKFITFMFFIGLIIGGTYNFTKKINYNYQNIILIFLIIIICFLFYMVNINTNYILKNNFYDNLIFFFGGFIDIFASLVPGISGTSLLMALGIYNNILTLISSSLNIKYVLSNLNLYLSYTLGIFLSFIFNAYLINYCLKKYKNTTYSIILGLSISSILFLIITLFKNSFNFTQLISGIILLIIGMLISTILDK